MYIICIAFYYESYQRMRWFHDVHFFFFGFCFACIIVRVCKSSSVFVCIFAEHICLTCRQDSTATFYNNFVGLFPISFYIVHFRLEKCFYLPRILATIFISLTFYMHIFVCVCAIFLWCIVHRHTDCIPIHNGIKCAVFNLCIH